MNDTMLMAMREIMCVQFCQPMCASIKSAPSCNDKSVVKKICWMEGGEEGTINKWLLLIQFEVQ